MSEALKVEDRVRVPSGAVGRVVQVTDTRATVLVPYQNGAVEVAEAFALGALEVIPQST